jgi:hypothetical protein
VRKTCLQAPGSAIEIEGGAVHGTMFTVTVAVDSVHGGED